MIEDINGSGYHHEKTYPAIFLDRDGVIIHNRKEYVRTWDHVKIYPQSLQALSWLKNSPYKIVIVTNQAGIGKGILPYSVAEEINQGVIEAVQKAGGRVDGLFLCPHTNSDRCDCRKPQPGLLLQAARALSIDLNQSIMIGDALSDIEAGQRAGVGRTILVLTGRGKKQQLLIDKVQLQPFEIYRSLKNAIKNILWSPSQTEEIQLKTS